MLYLKTSLLSAVMLSAVFLASNVSAQESSAAPSSEDIEVAAKKTVAAFMFIAQQQLVKLTEEATRQYADTLIDPEPNMPAAWMLMDDEGTVKRINIDAQAVDAPAQLRLIMYRAAIKSVARRGKIDAAAILYTGKVSEDSDQEALVIEYEHRLGISANQVIPYEVRDGKVLYGEPVIADKPFQLFYDSKEEAKQSHQ